MKKFQKNFPKSIDKRYNRVYNKIKFLKCVKKLPKKYKSKRNIIFVYGNAPPFFVSYDKEKFVGCVFLGLII